ncbi:MAG: TatD family hydrolase [Candidatus Aenigmarchaeota archaeon]|nr:TatD family hydrolase [Candidatus Aenigmarchaeota archaeon]
MIDTHCHLEQPAYDADRETVIAKCRRELTAVVTCAPKPADYAKTLELSKKHGGFVFAVLGIHPEYVEDYSDAEVDAAMKEIERNRLAIVGIGETGLDYSYVKTPAGRERQRQLFAKFARLANRLQLPLVVHIRNGEDKETADAFADAFDILEREGAKRVQLHMFGARKLLERAIGNGWYVSCNAIILRSKSYAKVVRDTPLERLMLETDAPWLHPSGDAAQRNDPTGVLAVAERVAEIKDAKPEDVDNATTQNASEFYGLKLR